MTLHLASSFGWWRYLLAELGRHALDIFIAGFRESLQVLQAIMEASGS